MLSVVIVILLFMGVFILFIQCHYRIGSCKKTFLYMQNASGIPEAFHIIVLAINY